MIKEGILIRFLYRQEVVDDDIIMMTRSRSPTSSITRKIHRGNKHTEKNKEMISRFFLPINDKEVFYFFLHARQCVLLIDIMCE